MCGAKYHGCLSPATNFHRALTLSGDARVGSEGGPLKLTEGKVPFTLGRLKCGCESFPASATSCSLPSAGRSSNW